MSLLGESPELHQSPKSAFTITTFSCYGCFIASDFATIILRLSSLVPLMKGDSLRVSLPNYMIIHTDIVSSSFAASVTISTDSLLASTIINLTLNEYLMELEAVEIVIHNIVMPRTLLDIFPGSSHIGNFTLFINNQKRKEGGGRRWQ